MRRNQPKGKTISSADVLAERIAAVRDECHRSMEVLSNGRLSIEAKLVECARLGDSLEATQHFLKSAVACIAISGIKRRNGGNG